MTQPVVLTDTTFETEVLHSDGIALVDFWASWCAPCRLLSPVIEHLAEEYQGRVTIAKLDVEANPETAASYGVMSIPTVLVFRNGLVTDRLVGYRPKQVLASTLDAALAQ